MAETVVGLGAGIEVEADPVEGSKGTDSIKDGSGSSDGHLAGGLFGSLGPKGTPEGA